MLDDLFEGLTDLEELGREQEAISIGADPLSGEWRRLLEISTLIAGELDVDRLLQMVMDAAIEISKAERGFLILLDEAGAPKVSIAHNLDHKEIQDVKGSISTSVIDKVLKERQAMLINDVENNESLARQVSVRNLQLKSVMGAPLLCGEKLLGMAYADNSSLAGVFTQKDFAIFVTFVNMAAVAIQNASYFKSLRLSLEQYRNLKDYNETILRTIPTGVMILDHADKLEYYNSVFESICPWVGADKIGQPTAIPFESVVYALKQLRAGQNPRAIPIEVGGKHFEIVLFEVVAREGKVGLLISDVTDRRKLEQQYYEEEKRALMTQLAGGIAHEISNHLFPIQGRAQLAEMRIHELLGDQDAEISSSLQIIEGQVQKIARIAGDLRNLSKPVQNTAIMFDLNEIVKHSVELMSSTAGKIKRFRIDDPKAVFRLQLSYHSDPLIATGDPDQIQQVLMNLIINAAHALEEKGEGELSIGTSRDGKKAIAFIADTGPGIPEELRKKIFEPYFTTKGEGKGTGLGLTIVKNIVEAHSGELLLQTEVGRGTRFDIILPMEKAI
ncbi:MAG: ATP-binding protein [bacterium]|nr:ATP-binding protein [bacterium]